MLNLLLSRVDQRFLTASERSQLLSYVATVKSRYTTIQELKVVINPVSFHVISEMKKRYPQFTQNRPQGFEKIRRDFAMMTALAGNAMFIGETESMDDQFTYWFKSILRSVHLSPQCVHDAFDAWKHGLKKMLSDDSFLLIKPIADHMTNVLCDLPEPIRFEDGPRVAI